MDRDRLIRAMEYCCEYIDCTHCEYEPACYGGDRLPHVPLIRDALDLIRQQAEERKDPEPREPRETREFRVGTWRACTLTEAEKEPWVVAVDNNWPIKDNFAIPCTVVGYDETRVFIKRQGMRAKTVDRKTLEGAYSFWRMEI